MEEFSSIYSDNDYNLFSIIFCASVDTLCVCVYTVLDLQ